MSRQFDWSSSQYLQGGAPITAYPFTMSIWYYYTTVRTQALIALTDESDTDDTFVLYISNADNVYYYVQRNSWTQTAIINTSANTWHHACAIETSNVSHSIIHDGDVSNKKTATGNITPINIDIVRIGYEQSPIYFDGRLAEPAIWNTALSNDEVVSLSLGYSPFLIRPQNLIFYPPLIRDDDKDLIEGLSLSAIGSPTVGEHPRVYYPRK
jgi:hypothetical protein